MPTNEIFRFAEILDRIACADPLVPTVGGPVRLGNLTGVALTLEGEGGNPAGQCTVDFGQRVWDLSVTDTGGGIAIGDPIYFQDGAPPTLNDVSSGYFFGYALEAIGAGLTATIRVLHIAPGSFAVGAGVLTGANAANVANANVIGGLPVLHRVDVADAATGDVDVVLTYRTRVIDAWAVKTEGAGGAANSVQVKNGANAITNNLSININDQAVARATTVDDAQHEIAAGGTLRVTRTKVGGNAACIVYVLGLRVA